MSEELIKRLRETAFDWEQEGDEDTAMLLYQAADALSRPAPAVQVRDGWALVPKVPTESMMEAGFNEEDADMDCAAIYRAMLAAAPATVATEAVAQGGGVDVEKVMALVEKYGSRCSLERAAESDRDMRLCGHASGEIFKQLRALIASAPAGAAGDGVRYGCHCDLEPGMEPDACVLDKGRHDLCIYAEPGMEKEDCAEWRPVKLPPAPAATKKEA